jgi:hypothetical protein
VLSVAKDNACVQTCDKWMLSLWQLGQFLGRISRRRQG